MFEKLRQNAALLGLLGIALAISVALASGVVDRRATRMPPLRTMTVAPLTPVSRDLRSALNLSDAFTSIAASITPGVVRIESEHIPQVRTAILPQGLRRYLGEDSTGSAEPAPEVAGGSGFIVSDDGYIVTNNHVVEDADLISVRLYDKRTLPARLVGRDPLTDIALLKVDASQLPALHFGDSDNSSVGEWVIAIGNPGFGESSTLDFTVTSGIISAKGRPLEVLNGNGDPQFQYAIEDFIQTDAAINPGNSGGPLINLRGEVVGMNTAIASSTGFNQGYAFAIPANLVQRIIRDLAEFGHVKRPMLGVHIQEITQEDAEVYKLPEIAGALVEDLSEDSPAARAGLQQADVIVELNGRKIERVGQLQGLIANHQPGEFVEVRVYRAGAPRTFRVKLEQAPLVAIDDEPSRRRAINGAPRLGIHVVELTDALARSLGFDESGGAVITDVKEMSAAWRKRVGPLPLRITAINQKSIGSAREAEGLLRSLHSGQIVSLTLETVTGQSIIRNIRVP